MNIHRLLVKLMLACVLVLSCLSSGWSQQHKFSKYLVDRRSDYSTWNVTASGIMPSGDVVLAGEDRLIFLTADGHWKYQRPLRMANGGRIQFANSIAVADDGTFYVPAGYGLQHFSDVGAPLDYISLPDYFVFIAKGPNNQIALLSYDKFYFVDGLTGQVESVSTITYDGYYLRSMFVNDSGNIVLVSTSNLTEFDRAGTPIAQRDLTGVYLSLSQFTANYDRLGLLPVVCSLPNGHFVGLQADFEGCNVTRFTSTAHPVASVHINERIVSVSSDSRRIILTSGQHNVYCYELGTMRKIWMYTGLPSQLGFTQAPTYNGQPGLAIKNDKLLVTGKSFGTVLSKTDGTFQSEIGDGGSMEYDIIKTPHGYLSKNGNTYALHYVDDAGQEYQYPEMFDAIAADENGFFFAVSRTAIVKFDEQLNKIMEVPLSGTNVNQPAAYAMTCVANRELWILRSSRELERYSLDGAYLSTIPLDASIQNYIGNFYCRLKFSKSGYVCLLTYYGRMVCLSQTGSVLEQFTVRDIDNGAGPGFDVDDDGTIFIAGRYGIQVFPDYFQDKLPPITEIRTTPSLPIDAWFKSPTVVSLTSSDSAQHIGIKELHYTIDSGTEQIIAGDTTSFTISDTGAHSVAYWAVDNAGNIEVTKYATVRIDTIAPTTTLTRANGSVTLSATDANSGVAKTRISVNGGAAVDYTGPISDAIHTITYWSEDVAGNVEGSHTEQLNPGILAVQASAAGSV